jgi:hypothetical protein
MNVRLLTHHYDLITDGNWSATPVLVPEAFGVAVNLSEGEKNDSFSFKVPNPRDTYADYFTQQDRINIHLSKNLASSSSDNLIMNGLIKGVEARNDSSGKYILIKGVNYSEISTGAIGFYTNTNINVMEFLEGFLGSVNNKNPNFPITWDTNNPTVKGDEVTAFPKLLDAGQVKEFDKSLYSILNKYLTDEYTEDGGYYWYISNTNTLVIKRKSPVISATLTEGVDFKVSRVTVGDDIANYVVVKCGLDPAGRPITTRYDDPISRNKYGFKYAMIERTIGQDLITEQGFGAGIQYPSSYNYTTTWGETVSTDAEWVQAVRVESRIRGEKAGKSFSDLRRKGLITVSMEFPPTNDYSIGQTISVNLPSYSLTNRKLRIKQITYSIYSTDITAYEEATT